MSDPTRRTILGSGIAGAALAAAGGAAGAGGSAPAPAPAPSGGPETAGPPGGAKGARIFFQDPSFEFTFQIALGGAYYRAADPGRIFAVARSVKDGDHEGAFQALDAAGAEASALAEASAAAGHRESARQAYGWAQNFHDAAGYFVDGSDDPSRGPAVYDRFDAAWLKGLAGTDPAPAQVAIPYEGTTLRGFHFRAAGAGAGPATSKRPLVVMNNGSDGSLLAVMNLGGHGALARGYDVLLFDGPGQGYALWKQGLHFRPDWEKVVTPVIDVAVTLDGVDPTRIALVGISQGGYWVPRAVAFEKRVAAAVADPGVVDVSASWFAQLPAEMTDLLRSGDKAQFDAIMAQALPPPARQALAFRMRPYGMASYFDVFTAVQQYRLGDLPARITCPMLVTAPEDETFWPGQSDQLFALLGGEKSLVRFTAREGAGLHCEPMAPGLRDLRIFDWLDETLR